MITSTTYFISMRVMDHIVHRQKRLDAWAGRFSEKERARLEDDGWFTPVLIGCAATLLVITIIVLLRRLWKRCHNNSSQHSVPFKPLKSIEVQGYVVVPTVKV
ncbi:hypothetical protein MAR_021236 [Mya arenaria]|uniref:Uncharacterized protein n=1 Tax=Mya arenaria TaxID=6604 RepID=A0ABY7EA99_MYAAR|nr:hypothetical protein MAR_021236 [Mya arenaria]